MKCQQGGSSKQQLWIRVALPAPFQVRFHGWQEEHSSIPSHEPRHGAVSSKSVAACKLQLWTRNGCSGKSCGWTECLAELLILEYATSSFSFCRSEANLVQSTRIIIIRTFWRRISTRNPGVFSEQYHRHVRDRCREASLGFFNDKVRPWSKRKRLGVARAELNSFLSVLAFDRPNDDISLLIQQLFLTKHRFLLLSFVDRFLPEILYIDRDKEETCLWWCYHCCQKSVAWLLGGLKLEQAAVSAWSVGLTASGFCSIWDGYIKDITISEKGFVRIL